MNFKNMFLIFGYIEFSDDQLKVNSYLIKYYDRTKDIIDIEGMNKSIKSTFSMKFQEINLHMNFEFYIKLCITRQGNMGL